MATTEEQADAEVKSAAKKDRPRYAGEYIIISNDDPRMEEEFQRIGIKLDAELRVEEEMARKSKTGQI